LGGGGGSVIMHYPSRTGMDRTIAINNRELLKVLGYRQP